jgi:hypothetical protein
VPLEEWTPSYVGLNDNLPLRKKKRLDRAKQEYLTMPQIIENITAFWITHGLIGAVSMNGVIRFIMIMNRMGQEKGAAHATQYFRCLITHIQHLISTGTSVPNFDKFIMNLVPEVETSCNILISVKTKTFGKDRQVSSRQDRTSNPKAAGRRPAAASSEKEKRTDLKFDKSKIICIFHHPKEKKTCKHGSNCQFEHVNTENKEGLKRYEEAIETRKRRRP